MTDSFRSDINTVIYSRVFGDARPSLSVQPHQLTEEILDVIVKRIESMKYTKKDQSVFEVAYNLAIDEILIDLMK